MAGNAHQTDPEKLKGTVTQAAKDRTITGTVTANAGTNLNTSALATSAKQLADGHNVTVDNASIPVTGTVTAEQATAANLKATVTQLAKDRTVSGTVDVEQSDPTKLKATVTQLAKDRTVTGNVTTNKGPPSYTPVKKTGFYIGIQSDTALWTPAAGKKFVITDIVVSVNAIMRVYLNDDATKIWQWHFAANGGAVINLQTPDESAAINNVLSITTSAFGSCSIEVLGYEV